MVKYLISIWYNVLKMYNHYQVCMEKKFAELKLLIFLDPRFGNLEKRSGANTEKNRWPIYRHYVKTMLPCLWIIPYHISAHDHRRYIWLEIPVCQLSVSMTVARNRHKNSPPPLSFPLCPFSPMRCSHFFNEDFFNATLNWIRTQAATTGYHTKCHMQIEHETNSFI